MTRVKAQEVLDAYERARLRTCSGTGMTAYHVIAEEYTGNDTGKAVSLVHDAREVIAHGEVCAACKGTGRC